jgi:hypothetical protein
VRPGPDPDPDSNSNPDFNNNADAAARRRAVLSRHAVSVGQLRQQHVLRVLIVPESATL